MQVEKISHQQPQLDSYLAGTGIAGLFARYVVEQKPQESSLAVVGAGSRLLGAAIAGRPFGLFPAYSHWVFASNQEAAYLLAQALVAPTVSINFPLEYWEQFQAVFGDRHFTIDRLYCLTPSKFRPVELNYPVLKLETPELNKLQIEEELKQFIGPFGDWVTSTQLYGIIKAGQLLAIGEMMVQAGDVATIQQVYTLEKWRGKGLGETLVSFMAKALLASGKIVTYLVSQQNLFSNKLAQKIGFELVSNWGYLE